MSTQMKAPEEIRKAVRDRYGKFAEKAGADLAALQKSTGWQPHSVRAALSTLRKAGYRIDRLPPKTEGASAAYKISAEQDAR